mgnify:CR=1 FL=1
MSTWISTTVGDDFRFVAKMEHSSAPATCAAFHRLLPYTERLIHCRWSGEGCWIPLGTFHIGVGPENSTSTPRPGEMEQLSELGRRVLYHGAHDVRFSAH